jgi:hypothetical protein
VLACARQIDAERWAAQHHDELAGEQAVLNTQMTKLHRHKAALGMKWATAIDYTKAQDWVRVIALTINHEGTLAPPFLELARM